MAGVYACMEREELCVNHVYTPSYVYTIIGRWLVLFVRSLRFGFDLRSFTCLATPKIAAPWATDDIKAPVQMGQGI